MISGTEIATAVFTVAVFSTLTGVVSTAKRSMVATGASVMSTVKLCVVATVRGLTALIAKGHGIRGIRFSYFSNNNVDIFIGATGNKRHITGNRVELSILERLTPVSQREHHVLYTVYNKVVVIAVDLKSASHRDVLTDGEAFKHIKDILAVPLYNKGRFYLITLADKSAVYYINQLVDVPIILLNAGNLNLIANLIAVRLLGINVKIATVIIGKHKIGCTRRAYDTSHKVRLSYRRVCHLTNRSHNSRSLQYKGIHVSVWAVGIFHTITRRANADSVSIVKLNKGISGDLHCAVNISLVRLRSGNRIPARNSITRYSDHRCRKLG